MNRRFFRIGAAVQDRAGPKPVSAPAPGLIAKVVSHKPYGGPSIDYQAEQRRKTRGLKSSRQIWAEAERAARKAARAAQMEKATKLSSP